MGWLACWRRSRTWLGLLIWRCFKFRDAPVPVLDQRVGFGERKLTIGERLSELVYEAFCSEKFVIHEESF